MKPKVLKSFRPLLDHFKEVTFFLGLSETLPVTQAGTVRITGPFSTSFS